MGSHREFTEPQGYPRVHHWGSTANSQNPQGAPLGSPPRIHKTPRVHHWGPTFHKTPRVPIGVPPRIHKTPRVHHWGTTANSQNHKGAPLGSHSEFTKQQGCSIGVPPRIHRTPRVTIGCTIGVPPRIHKTPRVHHWGPTANSQNPKGAPLGSHREFTEPQGCPWVHHWGYTTNSQNP